MKAIVNAKLILEDGIIWNGAITYDGDRIVEVGKSDEVDTSLCESVYDAEGLYAAPGLVDLHNHGRAEKWFYEDPAYSCEYFLAHGVTTVLPTFYHAMTKEEMIEGAKRIRKERERGVGRIMEGIYMEGPFMKFSGSYASDLKWSGDIKSEDYVDLIDSFGDLVKVWAIDPNRDGIEHFMAYAKEKTPNSVFAHGHSSASFDAIKRLKPYGVKLRTHITNADRAPGRSQVKHGAGGDEFCLYDPDIFAEMIVDETGIHVQPGHVKMIIRTKGVERVCLISDHCTNRGINYKNDEEAGIWYGPDLNYDDQGRLAGSLMTLDRGVKNVMTHSGYGLCHAIRMASLTPAEAIGIGHKVGSLVPGKLSNIIIIDDEVNVKKVIFRGEDAAENGNISL